MMKVSHKILQVCIGACLVFSLSVTSAFADYTEEWDEATTAAGQMDQETRQLMINGITSIPLIPSMDIESLIMMVQSERVRLLDTQLIDQIKAVQQKNDEIARLHEQLLEALDAGDTAKVEELQDQIDRQMNTQQMDMLRLQSLRNKRNESMDILNQTMKKMQKNKESIIRNI